jgi:hypothetical protein
MVVTGQTQESGKTTTLEALIRRSELPAIAFLTKRGEGSLSGRQILPYFRERGDWRFVESILESTMRERMKFERAWIVRACEGAQTLTHVLRNVEKLQASARRGLSQDVYMLLGEYLKKVVPLIASLPKELSDSPVPFTLPDRGLSVMDLIRYPEELQLLVIASTLEWIHKYCSGVITVIPEAWKFIPEGRNTPVKVIAEKLAREGAALKNFLWIDSQDIAGVAKLLLRSCAVWLIGVQREANEVKRAIANMPEGMKRPKPGDVATLEIGQFFSCHGHELRKVYVQPAWLSDEYASLVATGQYTVPDHMAARLKRELQGEDEAMWKERFEQEKARADALELQLQTVRDNYLKLAESGKVPAVPLSTPSTTSTESTPSTDPITPPADVLKWADQIRDDVIAVLRNDPVVLEILASRPEITVNVKREKITLDGTTLRGRLAILVSESFFDAGANGNTAFNELKRRGVATAKPNVYRELDKLTEMGFLLKSDAGYQAVPGMKVNLVEVAA